MARLRRLPAVLLDEPWFRALSPFRPCGQALALGLAVGPLASAVPGVAVGGLASIAEVLRWPVPATRKALDELVLAGVAVADLDARLVFQPWAMHANHPESDSVVRSWARAIADLPACALRERIRAELRGVLEAERPAFVPALDESWKPRGAAVAKAQPASQPASQAGTQPETLGQGQGQGQGQGRRTGPGGDPPAAAAAPAPAARRGGSVPPSAEAVALAEDLLAAIREHTPAFKAPARLDGWTRDLDLALRADGRTPEAVRAAIAFAHRDPRGSFWRSNILSGGSLRKQFDRLSIAAAAPTSTARSASPRRATVADQLALSQREAGIAPEPR